ncbi:MAG: conjugal transfer protein TraB [Euryarchaeota archaeon]|nr:conjugal transfer protein TraB [Euryarchaeota archaeon]
MPYYFFIGVELMEIESSAVVNIDDNIRLVGTAHISRTSADLVKEQIDDFEPDIVAVELDSDRLQALKHPQAFDEETLGSAIKSGKAPLLLFQSLLAAQQRKMGLELGEKPGVDLLTAVEEAEQKEIPLALIDRDVKITLRRVWSKMGFFQKIKVLNALLAPEEDEEIDVESIAQDSDLISEMMDELRRMVPAAGEVLIDERDEFLASRIRTEASKGKVLAVMGAGHLKGVEEKLLAEPPSKERVEQLLAIPKKGTVKKFLPFALPALMIGVLVYLASQGDIEALKESTLTWLSINAVCAAFFVLIVGGHPLSILSAAIASPITSLNPTLAAGWFAGAAQLRFSAPRTKDLQEFLMMDKLRLLFTNRTGKVLMVTVMGNIGSSIGAWIAGPLILGSIF